MVFLTIAYLVFCLIAWKKKWRIVFLGLAWFLIFLLPSLIFINSIGDNKFAERRLFIPAIGFSILLGVILEKLWRTWKKGKIVICLFIIAVFVFSFLFIQKRNLVWHNDISLDADTVIKSPGADLIRYNLALSYQSNNDLNLAKDQIEIIIKRGKWENLYVAYSTLGDIYRKEKNYILAISSYQQSVKLNPMDRKTYNNLGALTLSQGDLLGALPFLCKAYLIDPSFKDTNSNFSFIANDVQKFDNKTFMSLYQGILDGSVFKENKDQGGIVFQKEDCTTYPQGCVIFFSTKLQRQDVILPFLIAGQTISGQTVRMRYFASDPKTNDIVVGIDKEFGQKDVTFYFPTCGDIYYQTKVQPQETSGKQP
jgi:hypothetical protein